MNKIRVYDLPTRFFHWIFAASFLGAFAIAKLIDDDSPSYSYHMLLGAVLAFVVIIRAIWGFVGSRYARFSSFILNPTELIHDFKTRRLGHNAASSWAAIIMMSLALGLAITGYLMTSAGGNKEAFEEVHELLANAFIVVAITHVAGVILHTLRHRDAIGLSMIHGKKVPVEGEQGIDHSYRYAGLVFLALVGAFVVYLNANYDQNTQSLNLFGNTLQLGENESGENESDDNEDDE